MGTHTSLRPSTAGVQDPDPWDLEGGGGLWTTPESRQPRRRSPQQQLQIFTGETEAQSRARETPAGRANASPGCISAAGSERLLTPQPPPRNLVQVRGRAPAGAGARGIPVITALTEAPDHHAALQPPKETGALTLGPIGAEVQVQPPLPAAKSTTRSFLQIAPVSLQHRGGNPCPHLTDAETEAGKAWSLAKVTRLMVREQTTRAQGHLTPQCRTLAFIGPDRPSQIQHAGTWRPLSPQCYYAAPTALRSAKGSS